MIMERVAEVVRGWPYDGSLDLFEPIKSGSFLSNGDWVSKQSDGTVDKTGTGAGVNAGLVIVGNLDSDSAAKSGKAVVLWGNFIANVSNAVTTSLVPGSPICSKSGTIQLGVPGTDVILGYVLEVVAASSTQTAHIKIKAA